MKKIRLSNSQRSLYTLCGKKYFYKYIKKLRPRAKGSALFFGSAFDEATDAFFEGLTLKEAEEKFTEEWMRHEGNLNVKFAKADYVDKILHDSDVAKLEMAADNLGTSKEVSSFSKDRDSKALVKALIKAKDNKYNKRRLKKDEELFLSYANFLCMNRKGHIMLRSFHDNIMPHVTKVHGSQVGIDIQHPSGHSIIGYIDLLCEMGGYVLPNGKKLKPGQLVVADVKSAGAFSWKKHDHIHDSDQLDTYLVSDAVQNISHEISGDETNLIAYFVTSKNVLNAASSICAKCKAVKSSMHRTCNAEVDGSRCGGIWESEDDFYVDSKIVIAERNLDEARLMFDDYEGILTGVQHEVFIRNRDSCNAFGGVCDYISLCGKCPSDPEAEIEKWQKDNGEVKK